MVENSHQPTDYDAVLGGQAPPPTGGVVLGGLDGLRRRFALPIHEQREAALSDALKYGDAGVDLLVEALNDEALLVRATAYKFLQGLSSAKAQQAIANGILLHKGDRIYNVYKSAIYYGDDWYYITDSIDENYEGNAYDDPKFVSRHLFRESAEAEAQLLHQVRMLEVDASTLYRAYSDGHFNLDDWCAAHGVPLARKRNEYEWEFEARAVKSLQKKRRSELLGQLWEMLGFGRLAFVHEEIIQEKTYLEVTVTT